MAIEWFAPGSRFAFGGTSAVTKTSSFPLISVSFASLCDSFVSSSVNCA